MRLQHSDYMEIALREARLSLPKDVPVGCVIVREGQLVGRGHNTREAARDALGHAELTAIRSACRRLDTWRLSGCTLYVTLEPCPMCMGAILSARVDQVVFGAYDSKAGCCGSLLNLNTSGFPGSAQVLGGIRELECAALLSEFFQSLRTNTPSKSRANLECTTSLRS